MEIILLRHGKPEVPLQEKMSARSFRQWVYKYNHAGLSSQSKPSGSTQSIASRCDAVVCSSLPRSLESAQLISKKGIMLSSSLFNEAGLPIVRWKHLKLTPKVWAVLFRVMWLLGYSYGSESYKQSKVRADKSVKMLEKFAGEYEAVLLVGHGVYNKILAKKLKANGWQGPGNPDVKHLGVSVYKKTSQTPLNNFCSDPK